MALTLFSPVCSPMGETFPASVDSVAHVTSDPLLPLTMNMTGTVPPSSIGAYSHLGNWCLFANVRFPSRLRDDLVNTLSMHGGRSTYNQIQCDCDCRRVEDQMLCTQFVRIKCSVMLKRTFSIFGITRGGSEMIAG